MPTFEIVRKDDGTIKRIIIDNLAEDLQKMTRGVILQVITRTLEKSDTNFIEYLKELRRQIADYYKDNDMNHRNQAVEEIMDRDNHEHNNIQRVSVYDFMRRPGVWHMEEKEYSESNP
jgi:predicted sugar kinase